MEKHTKKAKLAEKMKQERVLNYMLEQKETTKKERRNLFLK